MNSSVNPDPPIRSQRLLQPGDPEPVFAANAGADAPFLVVCDHAGRAVPAALERLGLPAPVFDLHIAWDIGAAGVADALAGRLDAGLVRQAYSRLVIDCNRDPARADAVVARSDGIDIPGNVGLDAAARAQRVAEVHAPYHAAVAARLDALLAKGVRPHLILVHSFTPRMNGFDRPWTCGVLHHGGSPLSRALLARLRDEGDQVVGDNEPYAFDSVDYTAPRHAIARGLDYAEIEIRQDLIAHSDGQRAWAERLARLIPLAAQDVAA